MATADGKFDLNASEHGHAMFQGHRHPDTEIGRIFDAMSGQRFIEGARAVGYAEDVLSHQIVSMEHPQPDPFTHEYDGVHQHLGRLMSSVDKNGVPTLNVDTAREAVAGVHEAEVVDFPGGFEALPSDGVMRDAA